MPHAQRSVVIDRPAAEVFDFFTDHGNDSRWRPVVKQIDADSPGQVGEFRFAPSGAGTEVTLSLDAELRGAKKLLLSRAVQTSMNSEVAALDEAKRLLESA